MSIDDDIVVDAHKQCQFPDKEMIHMQHIIIIIALAGLRLLDIGIVTTKTIICVQ